MNRDANLFIGVTGMTILGFILLWVIRNLIKNITPALVFGLIWWIICMVLIYDAYWERRKIIAK